MKVADIHDSLIMHVNVGYITWNNHTSVYTSSFKSYASSHTILKIQKQAIWMMHEQLTNRKLIRTAIKSC